jgi:hypothetical protein
MSTLTVRFAGICCFMSPRPDKNDKFAKRVLLPVDKHARDANRNDGQHIPYIEFDILDRPAVSGRFAAQFTYARDLVSYRRYHLTGDVITITNAVPRNGGKLNVLSTYNERVPSISKVSQGKLTYPDDKFFSDHPASTDVAAIFDMHFGDLHAGPASLLPTRFSDPTDFTPARRLAQWVELQVPIRDGEKPLVVIESFNGNGFGKRTIELAETTDHITIGNQLKEDIEIGPAAFNPNLPPSVENFSAHFAMVYDLFNNVPANASRPQNGMTVRNGCVGSQIP